jgi:hypothetical protein
MKRYFKPHTWNQADLWIPQQTKIIQESTPLIDDVIGIVSEFLIPQIEVVDRISPSKDYRLYYHKEGFCVNNIFYYMPSIHDYPVLEVKLSEKIRQYNVLVILTDKTNILHIYLDNHQQRMISVNVTGQFNEGYGRKKATFILTNNTFISSRVEKFVEMIVLDEPPLKKLKTDNLIKMGNFQPSTDLTYNYQVITKTSTVPVYTDDEEQEQYKEKEQSHQAVNEHLLS